MDLEVLGRGLLETEEITAGGQTKAREDGEAD